MEGVWRSTAEVTIFLDSHIEAIEATDFNRQMLIFLAIPLIKLGQRVLSTRSFDSMNEMIIQLIKGHRVSGHAWRCVPIHIMQ